MNKINLGVEYELCLALRGDVRDLIKELIDNELVVVYVFSKEYPNTWRGNNVIKLANSIGTTNIELTSNADFSSIVNSLNIKVFLSANQDILNELITNSSNINVFNVLNNVRTMKIKELDDSSGNKVTIDEIFIPYVDEVYKCIEELLEN